MMMVMQSVLFVFLFVIGTTMGRSGLHSEESAPPARVQQCREGCLEKFATEDFACLQGPECLMSGFPTYNFYTFPDALHLLCWDQCAAPANKINTSILDTWPLKIISMVRHGSLVSADIHWPLPPKDPAQCLVTWEIAGGGLMGNLLTDTSSVELSLWPETKYRIQVTCKNKVTETISRSLPLTLDTTGAILFTSSTMSTTSTSTSRPTTAFIDYPVESSSTGNIISNEIHSNNIDNSNSNSDNDNIYHTIDINEAIKLHLNYNKQKISVWQKLLINRYGIIIGVSTSLIVFTVIAIIFYLVKQNYFYYYNKLNICKTTLSNSDNEKLIDSNSSCNNNNNNLKQINNNSSKNNSHNSNSNNSSNSCSNHSHNCINKQVYCDLQAQTIHV